VPPSSVIFSGAGVEAGDGEGIVSVMTGRRRGRRIDREAIDCVLTGWPGVPKSSKLSSLKVTEAALAISWVFDSWLLTNPSLPSASRSRRGEQLEGQQIIGLRDELVATAVDVEALRLLTLVSMDEWPSQNPWGLCSPSVTLTNSPRCRGWDRSPRRNQPLHSA